jgi:phage/conjugal plasmid C-4 type zinc finger TraR family protein
VSKGFGGSDFAQLQTENATQQSIERVLEQDREQAEHARELKAKGAYGRCEDCGNQIAAERLEALPEATRCIGCQSAWEAGGRST